MEGEGAAGGRRLYLVYTLGVPGLGKSSLVNKLKSLVRDSAEASIEVCVSDEVRSGYLAKEYETRGLNLAELSQEDIFRIEVESGPKIKEELNKQIKLKLSRLGDSGKQNNFFILDKNHSSPSLISYIKEEADKAFEGHTVLGRILVPDIFLPGEQSVFGPFKFETLAIGLIRSINREGHLTMKFGKVHSLLSFIGCLHNHLSDNFASKFPEDLYKRVKVDYYNHEKVEDYAKQSPADGSYHQLYQLVLSLANKTSTVKDSSEAVITAVKQIAEINEFIDFNDNYGNRIIQNILN